MHLFIFRGHLHITALYVELYLFHLVSDFQIHTYNTFFLHIFLFMNIGITASMNFLFKHLCILRTVFDM